MRDHNGKQEGEDWRRNEQRYPCGAGSTTPGVVAYFRLVSVLTPLESCRERRTSYRLLK